MATIIHVINFIIVNNIIMYFITSCSQSTHVYVIIISWCFVFRNRNRGRLCWKSTQFNMWRHEGHQNHSRHRWKYSWKGLLHQTELLYHLCEWKPCNGCSPEMQWSKQLHRCRFDGSDSMWIGIQLEQWIWTHCIRLCG